MWANPCLFLFIFILFKQKFNRKNYRLQCDSNSDRQIEGDHADRLTTTTAWNRGIRD